MNLDLTPLAWRLAGTPLAAWANDVQQQLDAKLAIGHGDLPRWRRAVDTLPALMPTQIELRECFRLAAPCDEATRQDRK
ncbi:MAG TPA: tRNA 5-methoxyuridine(34)/uridine 5-oxyacetic acid(34) synthase CmoB, partial [Pseudomonas sp.]|nr:tRNA 5-methoxyuridine(34)/uridine 5-oxyacetic acid(34) synthase CmoB [Pseudomonas sp.]